MALQRLVGLFIRRSRVPMGLALCAAVGQKDPYVSFQWRFAALIEGRGKEGLEGPQRQQ